MTRTGASPSPYYLALAVTILAWLVTALLLFLAVRFRVAPTHGDESDVGVAILFTLSSPFWGGSLAFALPSRVSRLWRLVLVSPGILALASLFIACIGVTHRP
jgi:hypothetical protein